MHKFGSEKVDETDDGNVKALVDIVFLYVVGISRGMYLGFLFIQETFRVIYR